MAKGSVKPARQNISDRSRLIGLEGVVDPDLLQVSGFGMSCGVYYRYFHWTHTTLWTLMFSMWYPLVAFSILPAAWYYYFARRKRTLKRINPTSV